MKYINFVSSLVPCSWRGISGSHAPAWEPQSLPRNKNYRSTDIFVRMCNIKVKFIIINEVTQRGQFVCGQDIKKWKKFKNTFRTYQNA